MFFTVTLGRVVAAAGLAVALAACTARTAEEPAAPTTAASTPPPAGAFVRTCESSVYGDLGDGWRAQSVTPLGAGGTQFNGGFLVAGPRCAILEVSTPEWSTPRRVTVSFGAGRCRG